MTDGRYDSRRSQFEQRGRPSDQYDRSNGEDRGFFDRARDEVSSWFGDDEAEHRRDRDARHSEQQGGRERGGYDRQQEPRSRDENYRRPYTGSPSGNRSALRDDYDRSQSNHYADRNLSFDRGQGVDRGQGFDRGHGFDRDAGYTRGQAPREMGRSAPGAGTARHDPDYSQWRSRQIDEFDRDYEDFRRENQSRFDGEFSTWRGQRQAKRQLLGGVTEHMDVVGSDDQPLGKVDWVKGDKIVLTKSDSTDGRHHLVSCSMVERIEDGKVILTKTAEEAKKSFMRERSDPTGERGRESGDDGPHMLNQSFSGTY